MKKIKTLLFIIISMLLLTSCSAPQPEDPPVVYDFKLAGNIEGGIFKDSAEIAPMEASTIKELDVAREMVFKIGKQEITGNLVSIEKSANGEEEVFYLSKDQNTRYRVNTEINSFQVLAQKGTTLHAYTKEALTEKELVAHITQYLTNYLEPDTLRNYRYSCETAVIVANPDSAWQESKDCFYLPQKENESISGYTIEYREYCGEIPTANAILIRCDENGNIRTFHFCEFNVDWSSTVFEAVKVREHIERYLTNNLSDQYDLVNYEIESQTLTVRDGKIQLSLTVALTLKYADGEIAVLCPFLMSEA